MILRKANKEDALAILDIIVKAQSYFKQNNIDQWQNGYPNMNSILDDIEQGYCHVICDGGKIVATAAIINDVDPNYAVIVDGAWVSDEKYVCVHRVATLPDYKGQGLAGRFLNYAKTLGRKSVRIDTHEDNLSMQRMILKNGFTKCGIVYMSDGAERFAYEWVGE